MTYKPMGCMTKTECLTKVIAYERLAFKYARKKKGSFAQVANKYRSGLGRAELEIS